MSCFDRSTFSLKIAMCVIVELVPVIQSAQPNALVLTRAARHHDTTGARRRVQHLLGGRASTLSLRLQCFR